MSSPARRICKKVALLLFFFALIPFPKHQYQWHHSTLTLEFHPIDSAKYQDEDWQKQHEFSPFFFCPQSIGYALLLLILMVLCLLTILDLLTKTVFVVLSFGVHWATYNCQLHIGQSNKLRSPKSSCLSVWVHGIGRHHYILRDIPIDTQCSNIYSLVSSLSGVPSKMLTLSNGSKFLQPRRPLHSSLSQVNLSHGVNLHCNIKILGGDGGDEVEGNDDAWLSERNCEMIKKCLENSTDPSVTTFRQINRKKLFKGGKKSTPNFCLDGNGALLRIRRVGAREEKREVVTLAKGKELVKSMHQRAQGVCNPGGINTLVRTFSSAYYCRRIRSVVQSVLDQCTGTCKLSKTLQTVPPAPTANRTTEVMEEIQCDLITIVSKKGVHQCTDHDFKYILTVKDCFSKYCWLSPLTSKEAAPIASILGKIFLEHGPPKYLHSDNGKEFINHIVRDVCTKFDVKMKHGRPYHPQSQGQIENLNRRVKNYLRHYLLEYDEPDRTKVWPTLVKEIEYCLNRTWHHTVQCTPYAVFYGRTGSLKMGTRSAQQEFMEEDFMFHDDDDEDLHFDPTSTSSSSPIAPPHSFTTEQEALAVIRQAQLQQAEQKHMVFEATEATICRNKRAYIKKMKPRHYTIGQRVIFKNPDLDGLASTLNVRGQVNEKVGRDLYRVKYGDSYIVLFGCQMVPQEKGMDDVEKITSADSVGCSLSNDVILDKICVYADLQRNFVAARRKYKTNEESVSIEVLLKQVGIEKYDLSDNAELSFLFYLALDCGFLATLANDMQWKGKLTMYNETLFTFLQFKRFHYYLSGIYFWEKFRLQTIPVIKHSVLTQTIPLFHYCSDCVDQGPCSHHCCRLWLENTCNKYKVKHSDVHVGEYETVVPNSECNLDGLMVLATVATEELKSKAVVPKRLKLSLGKRQMHKGKKQHLDRLRQCSAKPKQDNKKYKEFIEHSLPLVVVDRGFFTDRLKALVKQIIHWLDHWSTLTAEQQKNLHRNVKYITTIIHRQSATSQVKLAGTLPFMQTQGKSNYCGLCAFNNLIGQEVISVQRINNIADDLWLRQCEQFNVSLDENMQFHRDINGFHSIHTMEEVADCYGYSLQLLNPAIRPLLRDDMITPQVVLHEFMRNFKFPLKLLVLDREIQHYTAVHIYQNSIWYFDSLKRTPSTLTEEALVTKLQCHCETTYSFMPKEVEIPVVTTASEMASSELDDSQHITVRCQHCNAHYPLMDIKMHMSLHSEGKYIASTTDVQGQVNKEDMDESQCISVKCDTCDDFYPLREIKQHRTSCHVPPSKRTKMNEVGVESDKVSYENVSVSTHLEATDITDVHQVESSDVECSVEFVDVNLRQRGCIKGHEPAPIRHDDISSEEENSVVLKIPAYHEQCTVTQLQRLLSGDWLDSELLSFFMCILSLRNKTAREEGRTRRRISFLPPYFYNRWSEYITTKNTKSLKKRKRDVLLNHPCNWIKHNPSELSQLVIPININNSHWILCVIDFEKLIITSYDSLNQQQHSIICDSLKLLVTELYAHKEQQQYAAIDWTTANAMNFPCQTNGSDCGVYICKICDCILRGTSLNFKPDSKELRHWLLQQIFSSSKVEVIDDRAFQMYKKDFDYRSSCDESCFDSGEDEYMDDDPVESNPPFTEDDIIQPLCNFNEEKDDVFLQSRQQRLLMNKRSVYQAYCRVSKPIDLPPNISLSSMREALRLNEQYLRGLCRQPHTVKWKTLLGKEKSPHELQKLIKIHASSWPFENTAVKEEILFYVIAISEDEPHSNTITALHRATDDLLPEAMISLLQQFFSLGYEEAAKHYLTKTLPKTA